MYDYYSLTKPGIVRGNLITTAGGFFLASAGNIDFLRLLLALFGTACVIASACVFNNFLDIKIDEKMERTKKRALVTGKVPVVNALIFASILLFGGLTLLLVANFLTATVAFLGFIFYVVVYGYFKRASVFGTLVGSIPGATPPVIGYVAVSNSIDLGAALLFLILVMWQIPHFYAIAIFRRDEYSAASLPVLPVVKGVNTAKRHIAYFAVGFVFAITLLSVFGYTGGIYLFVMLAISSIWLYKIFSGFTIAQNVSWARGVFGYSLIALTAFSILISLNFAFPF